ncbi:MAG TPA: serine/threonine-protein kinase [Ktedonobacteraceae bacterium]|jgi:serine/threonine protein kinase|nr:serine/threonine-protein kinase [Ktedonobacteraceae bacterium]
MLSLEMETVEASMNMDDSTFKSIFPLHTSAQRSVFQAIDARDFRLAKYRLLTLLGTGGFAQVYLGEHRISGARVALKMLHAGVGSARRAQFAAEAALHVRLRHPHIIAARSYEEQGHTPFLVLDYASGGTMRKYVPAGTQLPLPTVASVVKQVASALHYIHERGIVHRDVKPENLLVMEDGQVMLSDFGNARMIHQADVEEEASINGTASYMAPEQLQKKVSVASDQYALGITAYEWLSGVRPFSGAPLQIALQHCNSRPPSFHAVGVSLPAEVEAVVMKALEKDPQQRFLNVWDFALALEEAARKSGVWGRKELL